MDASVVTCRRVGQGAPFIKSGRRVRSKIGPKDTTDLTKSWILRHH